MLTVALGVFRSQSPGGSPDWAGLMAAALVAALPAAHPVRHLRQEGRQLDRILRHEVSTSPHSQHEASKLIPNVDDNLTSMTVQERKSPTMARIRKRLSRRHRRCRHPQPRPHRLRRFGAGAGGDADSEGGAIDTSTATGEVSYWLWDTNQLPAYQACADAFHTKNPNVTVKISQYGWDDYWTKLTNGFVGGTAPDVFTNHLSKYPEFVSQEQLVPLDDTLKKDGSTPASTRRVWPTCGSAKTASATACRKTSIPSRSSTTRS